MRFAFLVEVAVRKRRGPFTSSAAAEQSLIELLRDAEPRRLLVGADTEYEPLAWVVRPVPPIEGSHRP